MAEPTLRQELESSLPAGRLALLKLIAEQAQANHRALYIVGGFVRDLMLGSPSLDFDFVVEDDAVGLARQLAREYGGHVHSHRRFGTAKWILDQDQLSQALEFEDGELPARLDFVTARSESYERPTALPSVSQGDIYGDLQRRDFSINALALRLDGDHYGELLDIENGKLDLERRIIRVLHERSFEDDPTRALRAARLERRLGFEIEADTLQLLRQALPLVEQVSGERIRSELEQIFAEPKLTEIMARLHQLGVLQAIHPELTWDDWLERRFQSASAWTPPDQWKLAQTPTLARLLYAIWLFRLPEATAELVCQRLRLSQQDRRVALRAGRLDCELNTPPVPSEAARCLRAVPLAALAATWLALDDQQVARQSIDRYLSDWRWVEPTVDGNTLRSMDLPPGPAYRRILNRLRDAWLDGELTSKSDEATLLAELVEQAKQHG